MYHVKKITNLTFEIIKHIFKTYFLKLNYLLHKKKKVKKIYISDISLRSIFNL